MNIENPHNRRRSVSIDGFVVPSNRARPGQLPRRKPSGSSAPAVHRDLGSFTKSLDGFKSSSQSIISSNGFNHRSADISMPVSRPRASKEPRRTAGIGDSAASSKTMFGRPSSKDSINGRRKNSRFSIFGRKNKKILTKKQKIARRSGLAITAVILILGSGMAVRAIMLGRSIFKGGGSSAVLNSQSIDPSMLKGEGDGRVNVMILGKGGAEQQDGPDLTDTVIIASIDPVAKEAALLGIPRDLWVKSPSGGQTKINQIYFDAKHKALNGFSSRQKDSNEAKDKAEAAGLDAMEQTITDVIGIPLHYYAMVDFAGFKKAVDTVDGIDINVAEDLAVKEQMYINGKYMLDVSSGWNHFDGKRALAFSRSRKTSARGDYARSDRQRAVMIGLKDKVLSSGTIANPVKLNQLMSDFTGQLETDFSVNEILRLYDLSKEIPSDKIASINLEEQIVGDMINNLSVQVPKAGQFDYSEIQSFVRNQLRDSFLKQEDAKIMILNGTDTAGLATKKSKELKSYGYNVISVGDAPTKSYQKTELVDLRNNTKKYTKNYLEKRLKVGASSSLSDGTISTTDADFVIILGSNEVSSQ